MDNQVIDLLARLNQIDMEHEKIYGDLLELKKELISFKNERWSDEEKNSSDLNDLIQSLHLLPFNFYYVVDLCQNKIIVQKGLKEFFGFDPCKKSYDEFFDYLHPEDLPCVAYAERELLRAGNSQKEELISAKLFINLRVKNGKGNYSSINRQSSIVSSDKNGDPQIILHLCNDLSDMVQENAVSYVLSINGKNATRTKRTKTSLTKREIQILKLIAQGNSSSQISDQLFISRETVDKHRKNMIRKSGCGDTHKLAIKALHERWI